MGAPYASTRTASDRECERERDKEREEDRERKRERERESQRKRQRRVFPGSQPTWPPCLPFHKGQKEEEFESITKRLVWAADTGYSMWHNA